MYGLLFHYASITGLISEAAFKYISLGESASFWGSASMEAAKMCVLHSLCVMQLIRRCERERGREREGPCLPLYVIPARSEKKMHERRKKIHVHIFAWGLFRAQRERERGFRGVPLCIRCTNLLLPQPTLSLSSFYSCHGVANCVILQVRFRSRQRVRV